MSLTREEAYDEYINPLMAQIIELCKEHDIPMVAQFQIDDNRENDEPFFCTTAMSSSEKEGPFANTSVRLREIIQRIESYRTPAQWGGYVQLATGESVQVTGSNMTDADTENAVKRLSELAKQNT